MPSSNEAQLKETIKELEDQILELQKGKDSSKFQKPRVLAVSESAEEKGFSNDKLKELEDQIESLQKGSNDLRSSNQDLSTENQDLKDRLKSIMSTI